MGYFISRAIFEILLVIFFGFHATGREHLPKKGPFIVASNHVSYMDPPVIGAVCNTCATTFMAKRELFENKFIGWWFRWVRCVPIDRASRGPGSLKRVIQKLKEGCAISVFPEGTRSPDGSLQEAESGIGFIALKSKAPVIPVYISGTRRALPRGSVFFKPSRVTAKIGKPVEIKSDDYRDAAKEIMEAIRRLRDE